jgi:hypothetical protein
MKAEDILNKNFIILKGQTSFKILRKFYNNKKDKRNSFYFTNFYIIYMTTLFKNSVKFTVDNIEHILEINENNMIDASLICKAIKKKEFYNYCYCPWREA